MTDHPEGLAIRASAFVARHRLVVFAAGVVVIVLLADAVRRSVTYDGGPNLATWLALALMAYSVLATTVLLPRTTPREGRTVIALISAFSPAFFGIAAALYGSPIALLWLGSALSLGLLGFVTATAKPVE